MSEAHRDSEAVTETERDICMCVCFYFCFYFGGSLNGYEAKVTGLDFMGQKLSDHPVRQKRHTGISSKITTNKNKKKGLSDNLRPEARPCSQGMFI